MITVEEVKNLIEQNLAGKFSDLKTDVRRVFITVQPQDLVETCRVIKEKLDILHISTISGRDTDDPHRGQLPLRPAGRGRDGQRR